MTLDALDPATLSPAARPLVETDDGTPLDPRTAEDWRPWVSATATRWWLVGDPLVTWLETHGAAHGWTPDEDAGADERTDMGAFLRARGEAFEAAVLRLLGERHPVTVIAASGREARSLGAAVRTLDAMQAGAPLIAQAVLRNPETRTHGIADLLVRSDVLEALVPGTLAPGEADLPAPALGGPWHYRVVDVKYKGTSTLRDGAAKPWSNLHYMAQVWLYSEALGRLQGLVPAAAYLLGRGAPGGGCLDRLMRVDRDARDAAGRPLAERVAEAAAWVRRVRAEGAAWQVLPEPTLPELYPNLKAGHVYGWDGARRAIAEALEDLMLVPGVTAQLRTAAHAKGLSRWTDPAVTAASLEVRAEVAGTCDAALAANRSPVPVLVPPRIEGDAGGWRTPAPVECYVDFETVGDLDDDFTALPRRGGSGPRIFQVGCGRWVDGTWTFAQWTADRLTHDAERATLDAFVAHLDGLRREAGVGWEDVRLVCWSEYEPRTFATGPDAAARRHGDPAGWADLRWFDALGEVVRPAGVGVTGAWGLGLKALAKAMHRAGWLATTWAEGPGDGTAAELGAYWCEEQARRTGGTLRDLSTMDGIAAYNEVDCRTMAEVLAWLRRER